MLDRLSKLDYKVFLKMNDFGKTHTTWDFAFYSSAVYLAYFMGIAVALWLFFHQTVDAVKTALLAIAAFLLARVIIAQSIYYFFNRNRPFFTYKVNSLLVFANKPSFPSGHATSMFAIATVFFMYDWRFGVALYVIAALTAVSRVVSGVHYPSDVIAGAIIGIISGIFVVKVLGGPIEPLAHKVAGLVYKDLTFTK